METGYIKLFRKIRDWEWYTCLKTKSVFIHCLLMANHEDKNWRGILIRRGQFLSSTSKLAASLNLSVQNVRTALNNLQSTGELTIETTSRYTLITIVNYDSYADGSRTLNKVINNQLTSQLTNQPTNDQQTTNKQLTTTKNDKNYKNEEEGGDRAPARACEGPAETAPGPTAGLVSLFMEVVREKHQRDYSRDHRWIDFVRNDLNRIGRQGISHDRIAAVLNWYRQNEYFAVVDTGARLIAHFSNIEGKFQTNTPPDENEGLYAD